MIRQPDLIKDGDSCAIYPKECFSKPKKNPNPWLTNYPWQDSAKYKELYKLLESIGGK